MKSQIQKSNIVLHVFAKLLLCSTSLYKKVKTSHGDVSLLPFRENRVTSASLARILLKIKSNPEALDSIGDDVDRVRRKIDAQLLEEVEPVLFTVNLPVKDGTYKWAAASPPKLLALLLRRCAAYRSMFEEKLQLYPSTPESLWGLIVYLDELTPGNIIRPDNARKTTVVYMSFLQLGLQLRREETWFPVACVRHCVLDRTDGGASTAMRALLRETFFGDENFSHGTTVHIGSSPMLFFAKVSQVIADEPALKEMWGWKGHAGIKPCVFCKNLVAKSSNLCAFDDSGYLKDLWEPRVDMFDSASDVELWAAFDNLMTQKTMLGVTKFDKLEKAVGMNCLPTGLLADVELRAMVSPSSCRYDSCHCYYQGLAGWEMNLFMASCSELGITFNDFQQYCEAGWMRPKACKSSSPKQISTVAAKFESFKGMAQDILVILPLMRHFAETAIAPTGELTKQLQSFDAMCECVLLL